MELLSGLLAKVFNFLAASVISSLAFIGVNTTPETTPLIETAPVSEVAILSKPTVYEPVTEVIAQSPAGELFNATIVTPRFSTWSDAELQSYLDARFAGVLSHVYWLQKRGNKEGMSRGEILSLIDKQSEKTSDGVSDSNDELESDISVLDTRLLSAETSITSIATSSPTTFLSLTDTPNSYTAGRLMFTDSGATALIDSAYLTFDGTNLGLGAQSKIGFGGTNYLYASSTNDSIAFGENAGATFNSDTTNNIALGFGAGQYASTTLAKKNAYVGYLSGQHNTGEINQIIGAEAGRYNTGTGNSMIGSLAGNSNTGSNNNILGYDAGPFNTGSNNNIFGYSTARSNSGSTNNIFGYQAGYNNTGWTNNILGSNAGYDNTGSNNNLMGVLAGASNTGSYNNLLGYWAGRLNTGSYNDLIGFRAGYSNAGNFNNMIGYQTGRFIQSTSSVLVGAEAFYGGVDFEAINNVALGYRAGYAASTGADNNILLGYQAADNLTTGANNIVIGYDIDLTTATANNTLNIGNLIFGTDINGTSTALSSGNIGIGTTTPGSKLSVAGAIQSTDLLGGSTNLTTDANGNIIRDPSDIRLKENIVTLDNALESVLALRGVRYEWIDKERFGEQTEIGFIAQEVNEVVPEVVLQGGEYWSLNSKNLIAVVVEAIKEMWAKVLGHEERLTELEIENAALKARLEAVEAEVGVEVEETESVDTTPADEEDETPSEDTTDTVVDNAQEPDEEIESGSADEEVSVDEPSEDTEEDVVEEEVVEVEEVAEQPEPAPAETPDTTTPAPAEAL